MFMHIHYIYYIYIYILYTCVFTYYYICFNKNKQIDMLYKGQLFATFRKTVPVYTHYKLYIGKCINIVLSL